MNQFYSEYILSTLYGIILLLAFMCSVSAAIAWNHWKFVLDTCVDTNCGCILGGKSTFSYFTGGDVSHCHWAVYGLLPVIFVCLIMVSYHIYRICNTSQDPSSDSATTTVRSRSGDMMVMTTRNKDTSDDEVTSLCWIPSAVLASVMALYSLIHVSMLTDGYYRTCNQYRLELVKVLRASGNQVGVIHGRLSCSALFDFMDYLQPDVRDRRRGEFINTAVCLQIALVCAWFGVVAWIAIAFINSKQAQKSRTVRR